MGGPRGPSGRMSPPGPYAPRMSSIQLTHLAHRAGATGAKRYDALSPAVNPSEVGLRSHNMTRNVSDLREIVLQSCGDAARQCSELLLNAPSWKAQTLTVAAVVFCTMTPASAQPVAVVVDRVGEVVVETRTAPRSLGLLEVLNVGSRYKLGNDGRLVTLFMLTGSEYTAKGPGLVEVESTGLKSLEGAPPSLRVPPAGLEIRLRPERLILAGATLRLLPVPSASDAQQARIEATTQPDNTSVEIAARRPIPGSPLAERAEFALWLEEIGATGEAKRVWKELASERPKDTGLALRAR